MKLVLLAVVVAAAVAVVRARQGGPDLWHEATEPAPETPSGT